MTGPAWMRSCSFMQGGRANDRDAAEGLVLPVGYAETHGSAFRGALSVPGNRHRHAVSGADDAVFTGLLFAVQHCHGR